MKRIAIFGATTFLALAPTLPVFAQDTAALLREFRGETPAQTRDAARWQSDFGLVLDSLMADLGGADLPRRAQAQNAWERVVLRASRPGADAERMAVERAMLPKLSAETPLEARLWLLKMVEWSGREEVVAALVPLLNDADPQIQERARRALANNSSTQAAESLRTALTNSKTPAQRATMINALAFRRDTQSSDLIAKYLTDADADVAAQAVSSLGRIGTPAALKALTDFEKKAPAALRPKVVDALLEGADRAVRDARLKDAAPIYVSLYDPNSTPFVRTAALRGLVQVRGTNALPQLTQAFNGSDDTLRVHAARMALLIPGPNGTQALAKALPTLVPQSQELLLDVLAERGDSGAKSAVVALRASKSDEVRIAAVSALGYLGDSTDTAGLLKTATLDQPESNSARQALGVLGKAKKDGVQVDAALTKALDSTDEATRTEAIKAISSRRVVGATPQLVNALGGSAAAANEAAKALGELGTAETVPTLLAWMQKGGSAPTGERAIMSIYRRSDKAVLSDAPLLKVLESPDLSAPLRTTTYKLLGLINTQAGFERVEAASRDNNEDVRDVAIRSLADWPGDNALPALLALSKEAPKPNYSILALRGVARLTSQSGKPAGEKLEIVKTAMAAATRNEEKQLLLGTLGDIRTLDSLKMVELFLGDNDLKGAAAVTASRIGRDLRDQPLRDAKPILQKALEVAPAGDAQRDLRQQIERAG